MVVCGLLALGWLVLGVQVVSVWWLVVGLVSSLTVFLVGLV